MSDIDTTIKINSMLNDNYKLLAVFVVISVTLSAIFLYFLYQIYGIVVKYYKYAKRRQLQIDSLETGSNKSNMNYLEPGSSKSNDDEDYAATNSIIDPTQFIGANKRSYLDRVESKFAEYNQEKKDWIQRNLGKQSDYDLIDDNILYRAHDNYEKV